MLKVIHFLPSVNVTSGIAQMIMNYYRTMNLDEIQFDFIYFINKTDNNFENEINNLGGRCIKVSAPTNYFKFYKQMKYIMNNYSSDDIIFHNHQITFAIFLEPILKSCNIDKVIVHNHMTKYSDRVISSLRNRILCIPIKYLNVKYFACSRDAGIFMFGKNNYDNGMVKVINNGINCEKYRYKPKNRKHVRQILGLEDEYVIGHVGHFNNVKNHKFIIEVFYELLKLNSNIKLLLIGNGPLKEQIEEKIKNLNIEEKVIILENRSDIPDLMSAMDTFIFPSLFEGLGIAAIEAQATGLPVFISDKVPSDVIINNCKVIDLEKGAKKWAIEINKTLNREIDRYYGYEMVKKSQFNIFKLKENMLDIYREII